MKRTNMYTLLFFYTEWDSLSLLFKETLHQVAKEYNIEVKEHNFEIEYNIAMSWGVYSIPTTILLYNSSEIARWLGAYSYEVFHQKLKSKLL